MDIVRLPKRFRDLCGVIQDGGEPDPKLMEAFRGKYPHQAAAVEAELAAFRMDWEAVLEKGLLGVLSGGFTASAAGIAAAVFFGLIAALLFRSGDKS